MVGLWSGKLEQVKVINTQFDDVKEYEELYVDGMEIIRVIYDQTHATKIVLEQVDEKVVFVHVEVTEWSPAVGKYLRAMGEQLELQLWLEGNDYVFTYNADIKFAKFMAGRDWTYSGTVERNGETVDVYHLEIREPEWA